MKGYTTDQIRNVALAAHGGTGKTTLSEAMLFSAGAISRLGRVEEGNTTSDYDPDEIKRKISVNLSLLPLEWGGCKVNLIDTPGYADFVGELKAGLRAADAAIILIDAAAGVQVGTENAWSFADERQLPRFVVINRMDRENANYAQALEQLRTMYGKKVVPLTIPIGAQETFAGVIDLLTEQAYLGEKGTEAAIPEALADEVAGYREQLIEAIAETDDDLITKYLEGEAFTVEELHRGLRQGTVSRAIIPVLAASGYKSIGVKRLLDAIVAYLPSPAEGPSETARVDGAEPLAADPNGPLAALVFKTTADPYVGKLSYFRVYSGVLRSDSQVYNANQQVQERIGQLFFLRGKHQETTSEVIAGDIGAVTKLAQTTTGDTLCTRERPLVLAPARLPEPVFSAAVSPKTKADVDKLSTALARIVEEDPTLRVSRDPSTGETILSGLGESHVEVAAEKMKRKFSVDVVLTPPRVPYRETITTRVQKEYIHKKQTGGHGQYARVALELEPLPRGAGFEFVDKIVGGVVPRQYIPAVEKGAQEAMQEGVLAHFPMTDIRVTLYDGKDHPVDSSEIAFKIAAAQALKQGAQQARPILLEPIMNLRVRVPDQFTGDVMGDLNSKRARVLGMTPEDGHTVIEAQAPLAELQRYATDLRSITQGRGTFQMEFSHYEEAPQHIAQKVIEQVQKEAASRE